MKTRTTLLALGLGLATLAAAAAPSLGAKGGTDVLHLTLRTDFVQNADPDAAGELSAMLRQQGNADVQKLRLTVSGLEAVTTYYLFVSLDGVAEPVVIGFDTDEDGEASLKLMHLGNGKKSFPVGLDSLNDVIALEVRDGPDTTAVIALDADLTDPGWLQYLVKRQFDDDGVAEGTLFMKEHGEKTLFRLVAENLGANTDYTLSINGTDYGPFTSDADGRLEIDELPVGAPLPFDMTSVEVKASDLSVVLSTELP